MLSRLRLLLTKESIIYSLENLLALQNPRVRQRAIEKFEKVLKIRAFLRISCSTFSSFSIRNLCLREDGSSVARAAVYRVRSHRWHAAEYCAVPDQLRVPPTSWWDQVSAAPPDATIGSASFDHPLPQRAAAEAHPLASRILRNVQRTLHVNLESVWLAGFNTIYE